MSLSKDSSRSVDETRCLSEDTGQGDVMDTRSHITDVSDGDTRQDVLPACPTEPSKDDTGLSRGHHQRTSDRGTDKDRSPNPLALRTGRDRGSPNPLAVRTDRDRGSPNPLAVRTDRDRGSPNPLAVRTDRGSPNPLAVRTDKGSPTPLALLREDFNQFKEDLANVFKIRREDKSNVSQGDVIAKQDLPNFFRIRPEDISAVFKPIPSKEDLINAFRIKASSSAERDHSGITSAFRIKPSSNGEGNQTGGRSKTSLSREDGGGFFRSRVFRSEASEIGGERLGGDDTRRVLENTKERTALGSEETWNEALRTNPPKENEKTASKTLPPSKSETSKTLPPSKSEASKTLPPSKSEVSKTLPPSKSDTSKTLPPSKSEARMSSVLKAAGEMEASPPETQDASQTVWTNGVPTSTEGLLEALECTGNGPEAEGSAHALMEEEEEEEEEEAEEEDILTALPVTSMPSTLSVGSDPLSATMSEPPPRDNLWTLKQYACYVTLDRNTASTELGVSEDGRRAVRRWRDHPYPDHPERFRRCPQVLCREGLWLERFYWEVEWSGGGADIGVAYGSLSRDGDVNSCLLGHNPQSWSVECRHDSYTPCHNNVRSTPPPSTGPPSRRVGVHLDCPAGTLSFYSVSEDTMSLIHTFQGPFSAPLYPAFWLWGLDASVTLCHIVLEWERQLL